MSFNIYECTICKRRLIAEEAQDHQCREVLKYEIEGSILRVFDGQKWYPLHINRKFTTKKTTADYTDTLIRFLGQCRLLFYMFRSVGTLAPVSNYKQLSITINTNTTKL